MQVNKELTLLYYHIGRIINEHKSWGNKFIDNLARDIKIAYPNSAGYSVRNLKYMAKFAAEYPDVKTYSYLVDAASMFMVKDPRRFQIVVTSNLFGDILTDLGAAIAGGMGLAAGANLNPERTFPSMFEPIHGSAPDIAGQNKANPIATILSAAMMLLYAFNEAKAADMIVAAVDKTLEQGYRTADLAHGAPALSTVEMTDKIIERL